MQGGVGSSGGQKWGLCASHSASWVCWAGFEDLRPKAASLRGAPREGSGSLSRLVSVVVVVLVVVVVVLVVVVVIVVVVM